MNGVILTFRTFWVLWSQLATESKAVEKEISDHEMENDSPECKGPDHHLRTVNKWMPVLGTFI